MKKLAILLGILTGLSACMMPPIPLEEPAEAEQEVAEEISLTGAKLEDLTEGNLQLPVLAQETVWTSADYNGKPILVMVMASWCPYCKMSMPALMAAADEYKGKAEIVGIFIDEDPALVQKAVDDNHFTAKALYNGGEAAQRLNVQGFPHAVLFDKDHRVVQEWGGFHPQRADHFREALKNVVK